MRIYSHQSHRFDPMIGLSMKTYRRLKTREATEMTTIHTCYSCL